MTALRAVVVGPSLLSGWTVPPERGTSEAEGVSGLESSFTLRRLACGEVGHSGRLAIRRGWPFGEVGLAGRLAIRGGDPLPPLGYSPFQVGESVRGAGWRACWPCGEAGHSGRRPPPPFGVLPLSGGRVHAECRGWRAILPCGASGLAGRRPPPTTWVVSLFFPPRAPPGERGTPPFRWESPCGVRVGAVVVGPSLPFGHLPLYGESHAGCGGVWVVLMFLFL